MDNKEPASIKTHREFFHKDKVIGKLHRCTLIGEDNGTRLYNVDVELDDDKHAPLFGKKHRIIEDNGKITLELL